jgi:hypothetical protein
MKPECARQIFEKYQNMKFHKNTSSGCRVLCGRKNGQTDRTKLIVAFRIYTKALKNYNMLTKLNQPYLVTRRIQVIYDAYEPKLKFLYNVYPLPPGENPIADNKYYYYYYYYYYY